MSVDTRTDVELKKLRALGEDHQRQRAVPNFVEQIWDCVDALREEHSALLTERDEAIRQREAADEKPKYDCHDSGCYFTADMEKRRAQLEAAEARAATAEARVKELEAERAALLPCGVLLANLKHCQHMVNREAKS